MPNRIEIKVNEIRENTVSPNGNKQADFSIYTSGESYVTDTPYTPQTKSMVLFEAEI
jgi:hypothetical protein